MDIEVIKVLLETQDRAFKSALDIVVEQLTARIQAAEKRTEDVVKSLEFTQAEVSDLLNEVNVLLGGVIGPVTVGAGVDGGETAPSGAGGGGPAVSPAGAGGPAASPAGAGVEAVARTSAGTDKGYAMAVAGARLEGGPIVDPTPSEASVRRKLRSQRGHIHK
ncbi:hypothetical protein Pmani_012280 [Petrolisthes manimaculis]|uniref:Uncharacterized protein n=1 Tax=Petrolisthes manimaculis TaxID=1843537 RepID=A0AAE1UAF0_9EUCA|nr:hypothetical protein Pmani_012280 [Petrolisthes manimaculis]